MTPDEDLGVAYEESRQRFMVLVADLSPDQLAVVVPACPEWTVKDLVAHVIGIASDTASGNVAGVGTAQWTEAQVSARKDHSLEALMAEWATVGPNVAGALQYLHPAMAGAMIGDLVTHEQDARGALAAPGGRDAAAAAIALNTYVRFLGRRLKDAELPALRVESGDLTWDIGNGEPQTTVKGEPFELLRSLTGRRTTEQIRALEWSGDPGPYLEVFSMYGVPEAPLDE